jgi:hypothetical protein
MTEDLGPLAKSLAAAQAGFPAIKRSRTVTVQKKTGGSYTFTYAPLDEIIDAVRAPLARNGLAVAQTIDDEALVTILLHESGASLTGRTRLPDVQDVQGLGSAITYLRRYALQAMLGIAAEEDDDGNRASGHTMTVKSDVERGDDGSLIGMVEVGDKASSDFMLRQTPDGPVIGFRLRGDKGGILVRARGPLADQLDAFRDGIVGQRVTCWGHITTEEFTPKGKAKVSYQVLDATRVKVPSGAELPMPEAPADPDAKVDDLDKLAF